MANFINIPGGTLPYDTTNLVGQVVETATRFDGIPKAVRLVLDWISAGASTANPNASIAVNLKSKKDVGLDAIRSVYIDNSGSAAPIFVFFPDLQYTVVAAPQTIVIAPVATASLECIVYGIGFADNGIRSTIVHLYNFYQPGLVMQVSVSGIQPPVIPEVPAATGVFTYSNAVVNGVSAGTTFNNVPFGNPDADRFIVACISVMTAKNTLAGVPTVTIGGVAATVLQSDLNRLATGATATYVTSLICQAAVPAGASGAIAISYSAPNYNSSCLIGVYSVTNAIAPAATATGKSVGAVGGKNITLAQLDDGFAVLMSGSGSLSASAPGIISNVGNDGTMSNAIDVDKAVGYHYLQLGSIQTLGDNPTNYASANTLAIMGGTWR